MRKGIRVLMVDDEAQFRATTKKILTRRGFETILAESGEEAIAKIQENPDVVVLDIKMPGIDGLQALKEIKKRTPRVPIIMLTGHGSEASAKEALHMGAFDYLAKPCEIDVLASKIMDAYYHGKVEGPPVEKKVVDIMIPIGDYTTLDAESTIKEAIEKLKQSFAFKASTSRIMETGHRSVLIIDKSGKMRGILAIVDLLGGIMPAYLSIPKPSMADSVQYSTMFWKGMFTKQIQELSKKQIKEIMSPAPQTIEADSNLMEAAYEMLKSQARRLAVAKDGEVVGVLREQDLFFEMERILSKEGSQEFTDSGRC